MKHNAFANSKFDEHARIGRTFSFDARIVEKFFCGWTMFMRPECDGVVHTISENNSTCIYLTNYATFEEDIKDFKKQNPRCADVCLRGMQFDAFENKGVIFTSYTYIPGTMRIGGYSNYSLK